MSTPTSGSPVMRDEEAPQVPGRKVAGWLIVCLSAIPLAMAARGEGLVYLWIGGTAFVTGGALALWPSHKSD